MASNSIKPETTIPDDGQVNETLFVNNLNERIKIEGKYRE